MNSAMADYIPEDNLVLILKHLPVKTLLRFRCVCKEWKQLIDHSQTLHQQHLSVQKPRFIIDEDRCVHQYIVVDPLPCPVVNTLTKPIDETDNYMLVGTLHGVVCLYDYANLVLWNPSLRKSSRFPSPCGLVRYFQHCRGFWIDPSTKEFKAVMLQLRPVLKCILYSSIRGRWDVIPTGKLVNWKPSKVDPPVMIGGVAHWGGYVDSDKVILSFDFVQESFELIETPSPYPQRCAPFRWRGTLSVVCWEYFSPQCEIYSRQEDCSWVKMVGFEARVFTSHVFWAMEDSLGETQENVTILATVLSNILTLTDELILHGTKTGSETLTWGVGNNVKISTLAYDFVESLVFV